MKIDDFEFMYHEFRGRFISPGDVTLALDAIKIFMYRQVKYVYITDLQMGVESNQPKVNILKPDQSLHDVENYPMFMILEDPEFGIVYKNANGEKKFLRFGEIAKYSDGIIKAIRLSLDHKLKNDNKASEKEKMALRERLLVIRVMVVIDERLNFRNTLRRIETHLGMRKRRRLFLRP